MAIHIGWRLKLTLNHGDARYAVGELGFKFEGSNQSSNAGTAFSTSAFGAHQPVRLFDTNLGNGWLSNGGGPPYYIGKVFTSGIDVDEIDLTHSILSVTRSISDFTVEYSDDTTTGLDGSWVEVLSITAESIWATLETRSFPLPSSSNQLDVTELANDAIVIIGAPPVTYEVTGIIVESTNITSWEVHIFSLDGLTHLKLTTVAPTYTFNNVPNIPYIITGLPTIDFIWEAGKTVTAGQFITSPTTPHIWVSGGAGTTGGTEPAWNLSGITTDSDIIWTYVEELIQPVSQGPINSTIVV